MCTSHKRQLFYFNSRPSARGDDTPAPRPGSRAISIHAPPRGATPTSSHSSLGINFNSRPSARGDSMKVFMKESLRISIHAPPRGATMPGFASGSPCLFQFTPLREGRRRFNGGHLHLQHFNSRPSARGDSRSASTGLTCSKFQFTPLREGRRRCGANKGGEPHISIHAPPRGATTAATQAVSPVT